MPSNKVANLTVTGKIGPGLTVTSAVLSNVQSIKFDIERNVISVGLWGGRVVDYDYQATATVTYVISGATATITIV